MAAGDTYQLIHPFDQLIFNSAGSVVGVRSQRAGGTEWRFDPSNQLTIQMGTAQMLLESSADTITAFSGGGQTNATQLTQQTSRITTVAANGDSVKLPPSAPGLEVLVINHGANSAQVFGFGTDTIDDVATATGVSQMASSMVIYCCTTAGQWYTNGIGTGYAGSFPLVSYTNGITAFAGGGQASATLLTTCLNRITTVATINDSAKLPVAAPGMQVTVANAAANSANIFPNTGDAINALGANAAFACAGGKNVAFSCMVAGQWHAILSA